MILEPVLFAGGCIQADREFVKAVREYCDDTGTLLVFDEIITGFRLGLSGAQGYYNVEPDLTVLGKVVGGGLPIGVICGRRDVMEHIDHTKYAGLDYAYHGNTFSANAITLAAGLAAINELEHSAVYEHIDRLGSMVREQMNHLFTNEGFPAQAVGVGSMFCVHMTKKKLIKDTSDYMHYDHAHSKKMFNFLLENGIVILLPEIMHGGVSFAHTEEDIKQLTSTVREYLKCVS